MDTIKKCKFIHIMYNDKFCQGFIDFIERNFCIEDHVFVVQKILDDLPPLTGRNVVEIGDLRKYTFGLNDEQVIICHSLFMSGIGGFYNSNRHLLKRSYWFIYGGDLYNAPRNETADYIRSNFACYITDVDNDINVLTDRYKIESLNYVNSAYTFPVTLDMIKRAQQKKSQNKDYVTIQINNSSDVSTLEILDILSKFKNEKIKIRTILSYGKLEYKQDIINKGISIYGDKFSYIDTLLTPEKYAEFCVENDILILNQNRQQGLGNSFLALQFGQKLFIRSEITTYDYLRKNGNIVFDTKLIRGMSFETFKYNSCVDKSVNILNSKKFFTDEFLYIHWKKVFEHTVSPSETQSSKEIEFTNYWIERSKRLGKYAVYNMTHPISELPAVDDLQISIYSKAIKNSLHIDKVKNALDFGCGSGRFEPLLLQCADNVYACDPTYELLTYGPNIDNVRYVRIQDYLLPFEDETFDFIFISLVLGGITDLENLKKTVNELLRVSKKNASFLVCENTSANKDISHWCYRSADFYKQLFKNVNLEVINEYVDCDEEISVLVGTKIP